jgi:hypothetical protein
MCPSHWEETAIHTWLTACEPFLIQEGGGLATLALLDLLDAGHLAAAPIAVTWIEGRLNTLLGQLGEEGSLDPWKVVLAGSVRGVWSLYLHNVPTSQAFLDEFPPKTRTAFFNRANFIRLADPMAALAGDPEYRPCLRATLVAMLAGKEDQRTARLREVFPVQFLAKPEPSIARENMYESIHYAEPESGVSIWAITPGGSSAPLWHDWLEEGHLCVGSEESDWDHIPDLRSFPDKESFYARYREEGWNDKRDALWNVRSLKPGDIILANQGRTQILGVGIVQFPGYVFRSDRTRHRHSVRVLWDSGRTKVLESPGPWWLYTIHRVSQVDYEAWFGQFQSPMQPSSAQSLLETQENLAEAQGAFDPSSIEDARERVMSSIVRRRGQQAFREALIQRYEGRCLITGCDVVEILEAAHILPYQGTRTNHPENGLLLRADIHTLFDLGLLMISEDLRVVLHPTLIGSSHGELHGRPLLLPAKAIQYPSLTALTHHRNWTRMKAGGEYQPAREPI